jgi:hypothetical protein
VLYLRYTLPLLACAGLAAQDTRNVTESHFFCRLQFARGATRCSRGTLSDAGENKPDTGRIQDAIDHCRSGQAVELKVPPSSLSRNPRDYVSAPGTCGIVSSTL